MAALHVCRMSGCRCEPDPLASVKPAPVAAQAARATPPAERLLEPFDPPALEALDRDAKLIDRPVTGDLGSTNPIMISTSAEFDILGLTGFGLFSFDRKLEPFASSETVASWQMSADGLYDKVVLRDDLVWSDGKPITAHDIAFTYQVIMDPRVPVPAVCSGTDQLRWVHAYDDRTVVFFHKEPLATNVWNINFPVLPKHVYENTQGQPGQLHFRNRLRADERLVSLAESVPGVWRGFPEKPKLRSRPAAMAIFSRRR